MFDINNTIYLVTGGLGFLGGHICYQLLDKGFHIKVLVLPGDKTPISFIPKNVDKSNAEIVEGDLCNIKSLEIFFEIPNGKNFVVIHCASMITMDEKLTPKLEAVNVGGTKNIIEMCLKHNACKKMVYVSSTGAIPELPKGETIKEVYDFLPIDEKRQVGGYSQSKALATQAVLDACKSKNLPACVVHPSGIIGPGDFARGKLTQTLIEIAKGKLKVGINGVFNEADARDLAAACITASEKGKNGECYILANKQIAFKELCCLISDTVGSKKPCFYLPIKFALWMSLKMEKKAKKTGEKPLFTSFEVYNQSRNEDFDYSKAEYELDYKPRPVAETIKDMVDWMKEMKMI